MSVDRAKGKVFGSTTVLLGRRMKVPTSICFCPGHLIALKISGS
jgi:hypothetical protein